MSVKSEEVETTKLEVVFEKPADESSEDVPMEQWSSLISLPEEAKKYKKGLYAMGLYSPGSGEICLKYISQSDSAVLNHPYYRYPAVTDPGIESALLLPAPEVEYPDDGQKLYLDLCKEMDVCPVKLFYRGLLTSKIDLKYYCVNPVSVRAMAIAIKQNRTVEILDLTDNFLSDDACFHISHMLKVNFALRELILTGCRIGTTGVLRLMKGLKSRSNLKTLNLSRNEIGDEGLQYIIDEIYKGFDIEHLSLSKNGITSKGLTEFKEVLSNCTKLKSLDLSWNNMFVAGITAHFITELAELETFENLNISWNTLDGDRIAGAIDRLLLAGRLTHLDISNNMFKDEAVPLLVKSLGKAKKLVTYNLSANPFTPQDALVVLNKMKFNVVKVKNLLLDEIRITPEFVQLRERVLNMKVRKDITTITHGPVVVPYKVIGPDCRELTLSRVEFLGKTSKKAKFSPAIVFLKIAKKYPPVMQLKAFQGAVEECGAKIDSNLIEAIVDAFPGPKNPKFKLINLELLLDYVKRKWPDESLPPDPPPESETEQLPKKKGKPEGKKKK